LLAGQHGRTIPSAEIQAERPVPANAPCSDCPSERNQIHAEIPKKFRSTTYGLAPPAGHAGVFSRFSHFPVLLVVFRTPWALAFRAPELI
jgi:hypothetical protein